MTLGKHTTLHALSAIRARVAYRREYFPLLYMILNLRVQIHSDTKAMGDHDDKREMTEEEKQMAALQALAPVYGWDEDHPKYKQRLKMIQKAGTAALEKALGGVEAMGVERPVGRKQPKGRVLVPIEVEKTAFKTGLKSQEKAKEELQLVRRGQWSNDPDVRGVPNRNKNMVLWEEGKKDCFYRCQLKAERDGEHGDADRSFTGKWSIFCDKKNGTSLLAAAEVKEEAKPGSPEQEEEGEQPSPKPSPKVCLLRLCECLCAGDGLNPFENAVLQGALF